MAFFVWIGAADAAPLTITNQYGDDDVNVMDTSGGTGITDEWLKGAQNWTQVLDLSPLTSITTASIDISHWWDGYDGAHQPGVPSKLYVGSSLLGTLTLLDPDVGPNGDHHAVDSWNLIPILSAWSAGNFALRIDTHNSGDWWILDHVKITITGETGETAVPEPATVALLGIGLVGLAGAEVRRRRKKKTVDNS